MGRHSIITRYDLLKAIRLLRFSTREILSMFFGRDERRMRTLEILLPLLEKEGRVVSVWHKGEKVYSVPRKRKVEPVSMDHEIACAEILVRLWRCRMDEGEIFTERSFRGFRIVPEAGIRYSQQRKTMLLFEYCTRANFLHGGVMKSKLTRYRKHLPDMEKKVQRTITVLFVIDVERPTVKGFVARTTKDLNQPVFSKLAGEYRYPFLFTDYQTFRSVPLGQALDAPIYIWRDGKEWGLSHD